MYGSRTTVIAVLSLTLFAAVAHGVATNRWNGGGETAPTVPAVPKQFGNWIGEDLESNIDDPALANVTRTYKHKSSGRTFVISLTVGHPGLTAVHTPDYCYRGGGYERTEAIIRRNTEGLTAAGAFWTTTFRKSTAAGTEQLRIFWSWSAGDAWSAPDYPRLHFMGKPSLYKLYVVAPGGAVAAPGKDAMLDEFLTSFLAVLDKALFGRPAG
jgi:hypothetical protein